MTTLRRWWRRFTARLHDHSDDDCEHCIGLVLEGYWMRLHDEQVRQRRDRAS